MSLLTCSAAFCASALASAALAPELIIFANAFGTTNWPPTAAASAPLPWLMPQRFNEPGLSATAFNTSGG
jgi:hypothetical protein